MNRVRTFKCGFLALSLAAVAWAQESAQPTAPASPDNPAQTQPVEQAINASLGHVTLVSPGGEPRREFRYAPAVGDTQRLLLTVKTASAATLNGGPFPGQEIPAIRIAIVSEVQFVSPEGDIHVNFRLKDGEVLPAQGVPDHLMQRIEQSLKAINGLGGSVVLDNRGNVKQGALDVPAFASPTIAVAVKNLRAVLEQIIVPLPMEAVGPSATWSRVHQSDANPNKIRLRQTAVYEAVAADDSAVSMKVHLTQSADRQMLGKQAGAEIELVSHQGSGEGHAAVKFRHILPPMSKTRVESRSNLQLNLAGDTQAMAVDFVLEIDAEAR